MKVYLKNIINYISKLESKIAFYPSILSLFGFMFAFFMYYLENLGISKYLVDHVSWLVINNADTARNLLSVFIGGVISIMVFSFSMVMILLNQASSNFSPRVLPGLISNKRHQFILGIFNASLLYFIFTLVVIKPTDNKYQLPGFSVLLGIVFMTFCLGAFIYFIHSISQEIQVNTIMDKIYLKAHNRLLKIISLEKEKDFKFPNTDTWKVYHSKKSGYFQDVSLSSINSILKAHDAKLEILKVKGTYLLEHSTLFKTNKTLKDEAIKDIFDAFHFSNSEIVEENYVLGFKQITEIAIKAMSPGINDPGTAINAIDYLTQLFALRLQKRDESFYGDTNDQNIRIKTTNFAELLYNVMAVFRTYTKHDVVIIQKLLLMLKYLLASNNCEDEAYKSAILNEINNLFEAANQTLKNKMDIETIKNLKESIVN